MSLSALPRISKVLDFIGSTGGGGSLTSADNGLSLSGTVVQLGGPLIQNTVLDTSTFTFDMNVNGVNAIALDERKLKDSLGTQSVNWETRGLVNAADTAFTIEWNSLLLRDNLNSISFNWGTRSVYATTGEFMADFENGRLYDYTGDVSVSFAENGNEKQLMHDGATSVDWKNRYLYNATGSVTVDYQNRALISGTGPSYTSIEWGDRELLDSLGDVIVSWEGGFQALYSVAGENSVITLSGSLAVFGTGDGTNIATLQSGSGELVLLASDGTLNTTLTLNRSLTLVDAETVDFFAGIPADNAGFYMDQYEANLQYSATGGVFGFLNINQTETVIEWQETGMTSPSRLILNSSGVGIDTQNNSTYHAYLKTTNISSSDKTFEFPNKSGVFQTENLSHRQISALYTAVTSDQVIECTANTFTVTLYTAVGNTGKWLIINNQGSGVITVDADGAQTINGSTTQTLNQYDSITIVSNGSNWIIV